MLLTEPQYVFFWLKNHHPKAILCPGRLQRRALNVAGRGWTPRRRRGRRGAMARGLLGGFERRQSSWWDGGFNDHYPYRIHGAGIYIYIYANIKGVFLDGIHGTPYIAAPWIRHGLLTNGLI